MENRRTSKTESNKKDVNTKENTVNLNTMLLKEIDQKVWNIKHGTDEETNKKLDELEKKNNLKLKEASYRFKLKVNSLLHKFEAVNLEIRQYTKNELEILAYNMECSLKKQKEQLKDERNKAELEFLLLDRSLKCESTEESVCDAELKEAEILEDWIIIKNISDPEDEDND